MCEIRGQVKGFFFSIPYAQQTKHNGNGKTTTFQTDRHYCLCISNCGGVCLMFKIRLKKKVQNDY